MVGVIENGFSGSPSGAWPAARSKKGRGYRLALQRKFLPPQVHGCAQRLINALR